mgnify:CR=1 FL=1
MKEIIVVLSDKTIKEYLKSGRILIDPIDYKDICLLYTSDAADEGLV